MIKTEKQTGRRSLALAAGILLFLLTLLPSVILGQDAYVIVHDQLDGEVPAYMLTAKHLGDRDIPEFMNGENNRQSLTPASWGTLLFYLVASPAAAFLLNTVFVRAVAFIGMYLLLRKWKVTDWIAYIAAMLFSLLDFYPVYGLAVMGQPLLLYAYLQAREKKGGVLPYLAAALFAGFSSPVLAGFADMLVLFAVLIVLLVRKKPGVKETGLFLLVLIAVYGILYRDLIAQVLGGAGFISHRTEWKVGTGDGWSELFRELFHDGLYHAESAQASVVPWVLAACGAGAVFYDLWNQEQKGTVRKIWIMAGCAALVSAIYATWKCEAFNTVRRAVGGFFISFRFERVFWLNPLIWWAAFGLTAQALKNLAMMPRIGGMERGKLARRASAALFAVFMAVTAVTIFNASPLKQDISRLVKGSKTSDASFRNFYSEALFREIDDYIGKPKDSYKVGSVGLYPSVPLYYGFFCIDGYSNNYDVAYKHAFREAVAGELAKKKLIRTYFDDWGNRCYLFSAELGKNYYFTAEDDEKVKDLALDAAALKRLGCEYILAGVEIKNAEETGLEYLKTFERPDSPYRIRLYRVADGEGEPG